MRRARVGISYARATDADQPWGGALPSRKQAARGRGGWSSPRSDRLPPGIAGNGDAAGREIAPSFPNKGGRRRKRRPRRPPHFALAMIWPLQAAAASFAARASSATSARSRYFRIAFGLLLRSRISAPSSHSRENRPKGPDEGRRRFRRKGIRPTPPSVSRSCPHARCRSCAGTPPARRRRRSGRRCTDRGRSMRWRGSSHRGSRAGHR